jgi:hypothetical protein
MLDKEACEVHMTGLQRHVQRCRPILVLGHHGALLDEELRKIQISKM